MASQPGPHDISQIAYVLAPSGEGTTRPLGPGFYESLDEDFGSFDGHVLVQRFSFDEPWPTWEVHPAGDEFVYLLEGDTDFLLWQDGKEQRVRVSESGSYVVVPRRAWHTAQPHRSTTMLFVTPGAGTLNADEPG
jgi:hypothetical protein